MPTPFSQYAVFNIEQIVEDICDYCQIESAAESYLRRAQWSANFDLLNQLQEEIFDFTEMTQVFSQPHTPPLSSIEEAVKSVSLAGTPFPQSSLLELKELIQATQKWMEIGKSAKFTYKTLIPYIQSFFPQPDLLRILKRIISDDGELLDSASAELSSIRKALARSIQNLQRESDKVCNRYSGFLQESQPTIRNGRIVLPVIDSQFRKVKGIVHGRSASGITIFIEPEELITANNDIDEWRNRERQEIYKILVGFADQVRDKQLELLQNWQSLCYLDAISAKSKWMLKNKASTANFNSTVNLRLVEARHPILVKRIGINRVVPLNITITDDCRWVLITGPNAGGKTVSLKTIAVNTILAHLGMPVMVDPKSSFPVLKEILFDIGDKQSIEDDLSTFSAHIKSLNHILENAGENTLVLIDELGTGTDPNVGSALAQSILESLIKLGSLGVANSHHGSLKIFAHDSGGITNASMEFSKSELKPTYKLMMDIPGSSYALEISRRMEMDHGVIKRATEILGDEKESTENLIVSLQKRLSQSEELIDQLEEEKNKYEGLEKLYQQRIHIFQENKSELEAKAAEEAEEIISKANAAIEKAVKEIKEKQANKETIKNARNQINGLKNEISKKRSQKKISADLPEIREVRLGDILRSPKHGQSGEVVRILSDKKVLLSIGNMKLEVSLEECEMLERQKKSQRKDRSSRGYKLPKTGLEIDLRGKYADEIDYELEKYIGDAIANGWTQVCIIHGKGTGKLQIAVNQFLKRHKQIKDFRLGNPGEGSGGVTIATLR